LIRIEVWQIGDSKPAPRFEVVGIKNDWAATLKKSAITEETSTTKLGQLEFWQHLHEYIRNKDKFIRLQTPKPRRYFQFAIGDSVAQIVLVLAPRKSQFTCELYINSDKQLLEFLKEKEEGEPQDKEKPKEKKKRVKKAPVLIEQQPLLDESSIPPPEDKPKDKKKRVKKVIEHSAQIEESLVGEPEPIKEKKPRKKPVKKTKENDENPENII
jgi:hypothetical protein